jgi:hypothetical protein
MKIHKRRANGLWKICQIRAHFYPQWPTGSKLAVYGLKDQILKIPAQYHPTYEMQRMIVSEPKYTDHQQWQYNTKASEQQ